MGDDSRWALKPYPGGIGLYSANEFRLIVFGQDDLYELVSTCLLELDTPHLQPEALALAAKAQLGMEL